MPKDSAVSSSPLDNKQFDSAFGLLKNILASEKQIIKNTSSIIDPISSIMADTTEVKSTLSLISSNIISLVKNLSKGSDTKVTDTSSPIVSAINNLNKNLDKKDTLVNNQKDSLKNLGAASNDISKLIETVSKTDPNTAKKLTTVLSSINDSVDKTTKKKSTIADFALGVKSLATSLIEFGAALILATPLLILGLPGLALTGLALWEFSILSNKFKNDTFKNLGKSMAWLSLGLITLGAGLVVFQATASIIGIAEAAIAIGVLGLEFAIIGKLKSDIMFGALAVGLMGVSIATLGLGLLVFESTVSLVGVLALAGSLLLLGIEYAAIGVFAEFIILGSIAVAAMGLSIAAFGFGLSQVKQENIDLKPVIDLAGSIALLGITFSGLAILSPAIALGALAISAIGNSVNSLNVGFSKAKEIQWDDSNTMKLKSAIVGVATAFSVLSNPVEQQKLGIDINPVSLAVGLYSITQSGNALSSLARGVSDFANMTFTEYEVNDGKIIVKSKTSLDDGKIKQAGDNIAKVLTAVAEPFASVGKANNGIKTNTILDSIFGGNFVSDGVNSITNIGSSLSSLAQGVQSFANMNFIEYGIKDNKIVPINVTTLTPTKIADAGTNIAKILGVVGEQFANVGRYNYGGGSDGSLLGTIFGGGQNLVKAGTSLIAGLGSNLISLADSVIKFANMEYTEHQIVNGKLVAVRVVSVGEAELKKAENNIISVLGVVAGAYSKIGQDEANSSGIFSSGYLKRGVEALRGTGADLVSMVDVITKLGNGSVSVLDSNGKVTSSIPINATVIANAGANITSILTTISQAMVVFGTTYNPESDDFIKSKKGLDASKILLNSYLEVQQIVNKLPTNQPKLDFKILSGLDFNQLALNSDNLLKAGYASYQIGQGMKIMSESINGIDLKKLTLTDSLFNSLAHLANISGGLENLSTELRDSIENSFSQLTDFLQDLAGDAKQTTAAVNQDFTANLTKLIPNGVNVKESDNTQTQMLEGIRQTLAQSNNVSNEMIMNLINTLKDLNSLISNKKWSSF